MSENNKPEQLTLTFPKDVDSSIDCLLRSIRYDCAIAALGVTIPEFPELDSKVKADIPFRVCGSDDLVIAKEHSSVMFSRFAVISMVGHVEMFLRSLLVQRMLWEKAKASGGKLINLDRFSAHKKAVQEARGGIPKMCALILPKGAKEIEREIGYLEGIIKIRNCLVHRLGRVSLEDIKATGRPLRDVSEDDTLKATWLIPKFLDGDREVWFPIKVQDQLSMKFVEHEFEWKDQDQIILEPSDCQSIGHTLSVFGVRTVDLFREELREIAAGIRPA